MANVQIGTQFWTIKNIDEIHFRNGDAIYKATSDEDWQNCTKEKKPAWCWYENNSSNNESLGKLYNWVAVIDNRGLAPKGWHIPDKNEWEELATFFGEEKLSRMWSDDIEMFDGSGTTKTRNDEFMFCGIPTPDKSGNKLKSTDGWDENGNNISGFNGKSGGDRKSTRLNSSH